MTDYKTIKFTGYWYLILMMDRWENVPRGIKRHHKWDSNYAKGKSVLLKYIAPLWYSLALDASPIYLTMTSILPAAEGTHKMFGKSYKI